MLDRYPAVVLPGIFGSDEQHWQTRWEREHPGLTRFAPASWDAPDREDWERALSEAVARSPRPPLLIAHSLATLLVAHWAAGRGARRGRVAGAFLVCVPDPDGPQFPTEALTFRDAPRAPLPFPALVLTSTNDPYGSAEHQRGVAADWGAGWLTLGDLGHVSSGSALGRWQHGQDLCTAFATGLGVVATGPAAP